MFPFVVTTRRAFVHEAHVHLNVGVDPDAVGAAVTAALCGHWEHEGACRWPHNNAICVDSTPAAFRTLFIAMPDDEAEVRARIEGALRDADDWLIAAAGRRELHPSEESLARRLAEQAAAR